MKMNHEFKFPIINFVNYDGDSFNLTLDLGFGLITHQKVRLEGVDTPEMRGGSDISKAAAKLAQQQANQFVWEALEDGAYFVSKTYKGKFGKSLGDIVTGDGDSLVEYLIQRHLGVPYHGQPKEEVKAAHLDNFKLLKTLRAI